MPVLNGDGPVPAEAPEDLVDVSSGEEREEGEREEGADSEAESRAPPPRRKSRTLRLSLMTTMRVMVSRAAGACPRFRRRTGLG